MRRRIQYLLPDLDSARRMMDDLLLARVEQRHIHVLARRGTPMEGLHEASMLQKSDLVHGAQRGLAIGAVMGAIVGLIVAYTMVDSNGWQVMSVVAAAILGALFGAWVSSMVAIAVPNSRLRQFQQAIEEGRILLMADVPEHRVEEIRERLDAIHPEAEDRGVDPYVPAFP
jgi:hypothetical protein